MKEEIKAYEVKFNDFGIVYIIAKDFEEALIKFWKEYGGNVPNFTLKSIVFIGKGIN